MKSKVFMILVVLMSLSNASLKAQTSGFYLRGDANLDGEINMTDVMYIVQHILTGRYPDDGKETMLKTPLTLEAIVDGAILFKNAATGIVTYKIDDGVAQIIDAGTSKDIPVSAGQKVSFYGDNETYSIGTTEKSRIISSVDCYVYGNIMSLINSTDFASATTLTGEKTFEGLFSGAAKLKNHPSKQLKLPATTLTKYCYRYMFSHCTHLRLAPALPATTLAEGCYYSMFEECTNLVSAPDLPATILAGSCYWWMFYNCSSLTYVNCLATNIGAYGCTQGWLNGVSTSGTFVKAASTSWPSGKNGIPEGWNVEMFSILGTWKWIGREGLDYEVYNFYSDGTFKLLWQETADKVYSAEESGTWSYDTNSQKLTLNTIVGEKPGSHTYNVIVQENQQITIIEAEGDVRGPFIKL